MDGALVAHQPSSSARSILRGVEKFPRGCVRAYLLALVRAPLYTLHNDVYRRTDGNNRLESKYLTLFRAMFRLPKSAGNGGVVKGDDEGGVKQQLRIGSGTETRSKGDGTISSALDREKQHQRGWRSRVENDFLPRAFCLTL